MGFWKWLFSALYQPCPRCSGSKRDPECPWPIPCPVCVIGFVMLIGVASCAPPKFTDLLKGKVIRCAVAPAEGGNGDEIDIKECRDLNDPKR